MPPITSSAEEVNALEAELGNIAANRAAAYAGGAGVNYSISGANGSESVDIVGYLRYLDERERWILERLQELQPWMLTQRRTVGGSRCGPF